MIKVYTPEMIKFFKDNAPSHTIKTLTGLFNKEFNANMTRIKITATLRNYNIPYVKRNLSLTPEMIDTLKELALKHKGIEKITDLFNKEYNTNSSSRNIKKAMLLRNIKYKQIQKRGNIGDEFTGKKNGTYIKISNELGRYDNWILKHHFIWEQAHGKIPEGYRVIFLDRNKQNFELDNLELVSITESILLKNYGFHTNNKDVTKAGLMVVRHRLAILKAMTNGMSEDEKIKAINNLYKKEWKKRKVKNAS